MRVYVTGQSGSGKTKTARAIASIHGIPHCQSDRIRHPNAPEYVSGAEVNKEVFAEGLRQYSERSEWVIDGILYNRALRRDMMGRADEIVYLALPLVTSERHVFKRRRRRRKPITLEFVLRRGRKARQYPRHKRNLEEDLQPHASKTVSLRSHRDIDRYLTELRAHADVGVAAPS